MALDFPDYFGQNWGAFHDLMRDFWWLTERTVVVHHRDIPLAASPEDQRIYVDLLAAAILSWKPEDPHQLIVAFDSVCEFKLRAIVRAGRAR